MLEGNDKTIFYSENNSSEIKVSHPPPDKWIVTDVKKFGINSFQISPGTAIQAFSI
jgi:hypothetical protein